MVGLPVEEPRVQFASWEEASTAGKLALNQFLQTPFSLDCTPVIEAFFVAE